MQLLMQLKCSSYGSSTAAPLKTLHFLDEKLWFPALEEADENGLLAAGGDLTTERLLLAYRKGIFPWFSGDIPLWWSPSPRFVLLPADLKVSKSMKQVLHRGIYDIKKNSAFLEVISRCGSTQRAGQSGTWINPEMVKAYQKLHDLGYAVSYEAWKDDRLVGGLYGVRMGKVFFGESMFTEAPNASKAAFITAVNTMQEEGLELIDCQVHTQHLESLGARFMDRSKFLVLLDEYLPEHFD